MSDPLISHPTDSYSNSSATRVMPVELVCRMIGRISSRCPARSRNTSALSFWRSTSMPLTGEPAEGRVTKLGIDGEPGRRRAAVQPAISVVRDLMQAILKDLNPQKGREVLLHVNGFGGTPLNAPVVTPALRW